MTKHRETITIPAQVEVMSRPGKSGKIRTNITVGWAEVQEDGKYIGSVNAKIDGSVEVSFYDESEPGFGWMFRLGPQELWRIANEAKRRIQEDERIEKVTRERDTALLAKEPEE